MLKRTKLIPNLISFWNTSRNAKLSRLQIKPANFLLNLQKDFFLEKKLNRTYFAGPMELDEAYEEAKVIKGLSIKVQSP
jgi:hypothetical protein